MWGMIFFGIIWFLILTFTKLTKGKKIFLGLLFAVQSWIFVMSDIFTGAGFDESVLYHLQTGVEGAGVGSDKKILFFGIFLAIFLVVFLIICVKNKKYIFEKFQKTVFFFLTLGIIFHPLSYNIYQLFFSQASVPKEISKDFSSYYMEDEVSGKGNGKNIVYLYLESFENTYLDENIFPGLAPNLQKIADQSTRILGMKQTFGTQWTIAGIVASQCGLPVTISEQEAGNIYQNTRCLGDILQQKNYKTIYMGGADLGFAGKGNFLSKHGFDEVIGKNEFLASGVLASQVYDWGLYDDVLFEEFTKKYLDLSARGEKFLLSALTLDTHGEFGVVSEKCKNLPYKSEIGILKSYHCTDYLIGEFFKNIEKTSTFQNTIFVITSDHYAMNHNQSSSILQKNEGLREHLFLIYEPGKNPQVITKSSTPFDKLPTVLHTFGFEVEALGLGVNLFSSRKTLQEIFGDTKNILSSWRNEYLKH